MIGAHPDVNCVVEHWQTPLPLAAGKKVVLNKLCVPVQIRLHKVLGPRLSWIRFAFYRLRVFPLLPWCSYGILDLPRSTRIIGIRREFDSNVNSIMIRQRREDYPFWMDKRKYAEWCWHEGNRILDYLQEHWPNYVELEYDESCQNDNRMPLDKVIEAFRFLGLWFGKDVHLAVTEGKKYNPIY